MKLPTGSKSIILLPCFVMKNIPYSIDFGSQKATFAHVDSSNKKFQINSSLACSSNFTRFRSRVLKFVPPKKKSVPKNKCNPLCTPNISKRIVNTLLIGNLQRTTTSWW